MLEVAGGGGLRSGGEVVGQRVVAGEEGTTEHFPQQLPAVFQLMGEGEGEGGGRKRRGVFHSMQYTVQF